MPRVGLCAIQLPIGCIAKFNTARRYRSSLFAVNTDVYLTFIRNIRIISPVDLDDLPSHPLLHPSPGQIKVIGVMPFGIIDLHVVKAFIHQFQEVHVGWEVATDLPTSLLSGLDPPPLSLPRPVSASILVLNQACVCLIPFSVKSDLHPLPFTK